MIDNNFNNPNDPNDAAIRPELPAGSAETLCAGDGSDLPLSSMDLDRERLISRLVDEVASSSDWQRLATVAGSDPTIFADLADTRRQSEQLAVVVMAEVSRADGVPLVFGLGAVAAGQWNAKHRSAALSDEHNDQHRGQGNDHELAANWPERAQASTGALNLPGRWKLGWAVAAALGLLSMSQYVSNRTQMTAAGNAAGVRAGLSTGAGGQAGLMNISSAQQALDAYYKLGRQAGSVVTEVPQRYVLESRSLPDGRQEVLFLRQVVERAIVSDVYRIGSDEQGRPVLVPSAPATSAGPAL